MWAEQQILAVLLNVVSNRLRTDEVVSSDGATVSQAIQQAYALWSEWTPASRERAKDIAEAMNEGRMIPAGAIDLTLPMIYYARPMPSTPAAGHVRVAPNPMVRSSTLDFDLAREGPVEVKVFDITGRVVRTLLDAELPSAGRLNPVEINAIGDPRASFAQLTASFAVLRR